MAGGVAFRRRGATWSIPYSDPALTFFKIGGTIDLGLQADRNLAVGVHPLDRRLVLLASRRAGLLGSTDGGMTWDAGRWPVPDLRTFHADSLCLTFDPEDPSGNTVVVGSDGGVFVSSDVGVTWDSSYNARFPTLMFVQEARSTAPALSASSRFPGLLVGSLQDNGNVYLTQPGENWQELFDGGDGQRALFVTGDVVLRGGNDAVDLRWSRWTGTEFTDPVAFEPPGFPANTTFMPFLARVPDPRYHDPQGGALMVAVAGDDFGLVGTNNIYGLFDKGAAVTTDRFYWKTVGTVPFATTGVGTLTVTGRVFLVGTASTHMYRIDPSTGSVVELILPVGLGSDGVRWPTMAGGSVAFALHGDTILRTMNLVTWQAVTSPAAGATVEVLAVDRSRDPIGLYAAGVEGAWLSRDLGSTWRTTSGLPRRPQANHLEVVDTGAAGRWIHLGTWNWSAWRARLA